MSDDAHEGDRAMSLPQWAREVMGWRSASAAYKARDEGRLVFADAEKKRVWAQASLAKYEAGKNPAYPKRGGVGKAESVGAGPRACPSAGQPQGGAPTDETAAQGALDFGAGYDYQGAKAKREHFAAERERMSYLREAGELVALADVRAAWAQAGAVLRARLETLAALLPPELVGKDEAQQRATIAEHVHDALGAAHAAIARLGLQQEAAA